MFDLLDENPTVLRFFHDQSLIVDAERLSGAMDAYAEFTERFLRNGIAKGFLRADLDVEVTAQALVALIFEGTRRALRSPDDADMRRRWLDAGTALMFDGIAGG